MRPVWTNDSFYNILRKYVDFCTRTSFSSITIEGVENIPSEGAIMFAPNHRMSLMDPLLILLLRKEATAFGAKADLFHNPKIASILNWFRILPIARKCDGPLREVSNNLSVFDTIVDCMDHDTPFCLFSEGTHRPERGMMPVKKGIFRICRLAMDKCEKPVYIVPVGIDYESFHKQMCRAAVRVGEAIDMREFMRTHSDIQDRELYQILCSDLQSRILSLTDRIPERKKGLIPLRISASILSLPLFVVCAAASLPIWLIAKLFMYKNEDQAWMHTAVYCCRFLFPLLLPFYWLYAFLCNLYSFLLEDLREIITQRKS